MARGENITRVECGLQRGEGWVERREREDGSIVFASRWYDGTGKDRKLQYYPHPHPEGADERDTIDQAADYNRSIARKKRRGTYTAPETRTVSMLVGEYLDRNRSKWKAATLYTFTHRKRKMIDPYIGDVRIAALTSDRLQSWIDELQDDSYNPRTIQGAITVVSGALRSARRLKIITENLLEGVEIPQARAVTHRTWSAGEIVKVLNYVAGNDQYEAVYWVALMTGARPGELEALRWADVDLGNAEILIAHTRTRNERGSWVIGETTKTGASRRVAIPPGCVAALRRLQEVQQRQRQASRRWVDNGFVFAGQYGGRLELQQLARFQDAMTEKLGIPRLTLHELRHTNATVEMAANVSPKIVMERLGHRDVKTTLAFYSHATPPMHREAVDDLERRLLVRSDTTTSVQEPDKTD